MIDTSNINHDLFNAVKPYLGGMSLAEINILCEHLRHDSLHKFEEWVLNSKNRKYFVFYDVNKNILAKYLKKGA